MEPGVPGAHLCAVGAAGLRAVLDGPLTRDATGESPPHLVVTGARPCRLNPEGIWAQGIPASTFGADGVARGLRSCLISALPDDVPGSPNRDLWRTRAVNHLVT